VTKLKVGIVDYGVGNHGSLYRTLTHLGFRCCVSDDYGQLKDCALLLLPGVGAFRPAMQNLESKGLARFLVDQSLDQKPIIGICLGMQLLGQSSSEDGWKVGLGLIPGNVVRLERDLWHIGWNSLKLQKSDPIFNDVQNHYFYFNHSYAYKLSDNFVSCTSTFEDKCFPSVVRNGNVVGFQFHPEKSQRAGHVLLRSVIEGLCDA